MSTGCEPCAIAATNVETGRFNPGCYECNARALAGGPLYHASVKAGAMTSNYRAALQSMFGANWKHGHERAKHWAERVKAFHAEQSEA